jgi:hypothetical protein
VIEETLLAEVPRVEMAATNVLPFAGAEPRVTENEVTALVPVFPVALCTRDVVAAALACFAGAATHMLTARASTIMIGIHLEFIFFAPLS